MIRKKLNHINNLINLEKEAPPDYSWAPSMATWASGVMAWVGQVMAGEWAGHKILVDAGADFHSTDGNEIAAWIDFYRNTEGEEVEGDPETDFFILRWSELEDLLSKLSINWETPLQSFIQVSDMYGKRRP